MASTVLSPSVTVRSSQRKENEFSTTLPEEEIYHLDRGRPPFRGIEAKRSSSRAEMSGRPATFTALVFQSLMSWKTRCRLGHNSQQRSSIWERYAADRLWFIHEG